MAELAEKTGQFRQNLSNKMSHDNFSKSDANAMATALGCTFRAEFVMDDTGESI